MTRALAQHVDIGDDEPVTLAEACRTFFGGRLSPSALRTEAAKGNLVIMQIARKDFVTRRAIEEMKQKCRAPKSRLASAPDPNPTPKVGPVPSGSSRTETHISAQDALRIKLQKLNKSLPNTSPKNTKLPGEVVPLR